MSIVLVSSPIDFCPLAKFGRRVEKKKLNVLKEITEKKFAANSGRLFADHCPRLKKATLKGSTNNIKEKTSKTIIP